MDRKANSSAGVGYFLLLLAMLVGCKANPSNPPGEDAGIVDGGGGGNGGGGVGGNGTGGAIPDDAGMPDAPPATVEEDPTHPKGDDGTELPFTAAPLLEGVNVLANRDSARILLPVVPGAQDYRVFPLPKGVAIESDAEGHETVVGSTLYCAGFRQHNAAAGPLELLRQVEVAGLLGETRLVVEAVDATCPFTGVRGAVHADLDAQNPTLPLADRGPFAVYTEAEIVQQYRSLIVNGHAPAAHPGSPAPPLSPKVLARTTLRVTPLGYGSHGLTFLDDFAAPDQPAFVKAVPVFDRSQKGALYQNTNFSFYTYGADLAQFFIDRGRLHTVLADWEQEIFASNIAYPRKPVALSDTDYLRVTYDVPSNATQRRYWWLVLCGADTLGATMDAGGKLLGNIIQTPFFYQDDGLNPSVEGWNCLQVFPRDGYGFPLPPTNTTPESDVRVMVNLPDTAIRDSVVNVSPPMYDEAVGAPSWYRQRDGQGKLFAPMLDDQLFVGQSTRFELFVRRDRVVLFVNGEQRLCNDFPAVALTMAEGALGFGQVLYHSAAEREEFSAPYWVRTGQRYYLTNTPFLDARTWDNVGYAEHAALPGTFDASSCYVYTP
jgi:hypothetical protein